MFIPTEEQLRNGFKKLQSIQSAAAEAMNLHLPPAFTFPTVCTANFHPSFSEASSSPSGIDLCRGKAVAHGTLHFLGPQKNDRVGTRSTVSLHQGQLSHVLNVLHPGTKQGNAYTIAYVLRTRTQVLLTRISCLTRSLRWLTLAYAHQSFSYATPLQGAPS